MHKPPIHKNAPIGNVYIIPGVRPTERPPLGNLEVATRGYFKAVHIPLLRGRLCGEALWLMIMIRARVMNLLWHEVAQQHWCGYVPCIMDNPLASFD